MTKVVMVDIQPNLDFKEAIRSLISSKEVKDGNIGLERLYELIGCSIVERVVLGQLKNGNSLDLIIDEEGTYGQWNRGIEIFNDDNYKYQILGNCVFVQATPEGDWIGWDDENEMADAINPYIMKSSFFELAKK